MTDRIEEREAIIKCENHQWRVCSVSSKRNTYTENKIEMVEKRAYERLLERVDELEKQNAIVSIKNESFAEKVGWLEGNLADLEEENEKLQEKLTVAVAALKEAAKWHGSDDPNGAAGELAFEALKKIEGEDVE